MTWFRDGDGPERYNETTRAIAVVGAGASLPIMPIARELAEELEKQLTAGDSKEREEQLDMLEIAYGLPRKAFETRLMALSRIKGERAVQDAIGSRYRHRHPTLLTYELLAHLLHHRFLDTIVSFNFDELLDQSIEDELGPNEFTRVVSERDFYPSRGVSGPLYVKPHGTAAEPESLRFTKERYFTIPKSIGSLIEDRFDVDRLIVLNLGFSMTNIDFQYLLRKPREVEIFNFNPHSLQDEVVEEIVSRRRPQRERRDVQRAKEYDRPIVYELAPQDADPNDPELLGDCLVEVTDSLSAVCEEPQAGPASWRSIQRHLALVRLLREYDQSNEKRQAEYLRRRAVLEIAFAAAKGRGVVSIAPMVDDRCGRYYDLYAARADHVDDWPKVCRDGGLEESEEAPDTYEILPGVRTPGAVQKVDVHQLRLADPSLLAGHVIKSLGASRTEKGKLTELLTETLEVLQHDSEIEVHSRDDRVCSKIFATPRILPTLTALRGWTQELLRSTHSYNELWVISETGEWLCAEPVADLVRSRCEKVKLLRAFEAQAPSGGPFELRKLPWGRHNRHMTILCDNGEPRAAIYFVRRLRAITITPVMLSDQRDLTRVKRAFSQLWQEADEYETKRALGAMAEFSRPSRSPAPSP